MSGMAALLQRLRRFAEQRVHADGQIVEVDVSSAMHRGSNTITVMAQGREDGSAIILIADN